jgi:hypothetical protein
MISSKTRQQAMDREREERDNDVTTLSATLSPLPRESHPQHSHFTVLHVYMCQLHRTGNRLVPKRMGVEGGLDA